MKKIPLGADQFDTHFRLEDLTEDDLASFPKHERWLIEHNPDKWVKEMVRKEDGFVRHSIRPYEQGYGCDGTTDSNIHLIAYTLAKRLEIDYMGLYEEIYVLNPKGTTMDTGEFEAWITADEVVNETAIPDNILIDHVIADLVDINYKTLAERLKTAIESKFSIEITRSMDDNGDYTNPIFEKDLVRTVT